MSGFLMVTPRHVKAYSKHYYTIPWQRVADFAPPYFVKKESRHKVLSYVTRTFSRFLAGVMVK